MPKIGGRPASSASSRATAINALQGLDTTTSARNATGGAGGDGTQGKIIHKHHEKIGKSSIFMMVNVPLSIAFFGFPDDRYSVIM